MASKIQGLCGEAKTLLGVWGQVDEKTSAKTIYTGEPFLLVAPSIMLVAPSFPRFKSKLYLHMNNVAKVLGCSSASFEV